VNKVAQDAIQQRVTTQEQKLKTSNEIHEVFKSTVNEKLDVLISEGRQRTFSNGNEQQ